MHKLFSYIIICSLNCCIFLQVAQSSDDLDFKYNSILIEKRSFENFSISANYYPIYDNIEIYPPADFATKRPSKSDLIHFARNTPSYFFTIYEDGNISYVITLQQKASEAGSGFEYHVINTYNQVSIEMPCSFDAQVTEKRSEELCEIGSGKMNNQIKSKKKSLLLLDKIYYSVQPYDSVLSEVVRIADELVNPPETEYGYAEDFIRSETIGGKLDFRISLRDDGKQLYIVSGTAFDQNSFAILLWGIAVKKMKVKSSKKAIQLWQEINERELSKLEKKALITGYISEDT